MRDWKKSGISIAAAVWMILTALGPAPAPAAELDRQVDSMMADFAPIIRSLAGGEPFLIAAGPFFDPAAKARDPLCRDAEERVFVQIIKRFLETEGAVIVDWKRSKPLTAVKDDASGKMRYRLSDAVRHLKGASKGGFLITGYADSPGSKARLRAELVTIPEGDIAGRFGPPVKAEEAGSLVAAPLSAMKAAPAPAAGTPRAESGAGSAVDPSPTGSVSAGPAVPAAPKESQTAAAPETAAPKSAPEPLPAEKAAEVALTSTVIEGKNFRYEGQVDAEGSKQGHGTLVFDSEDRYSGQWVNDRMNGEGTYEFANGARYVGQWRDNKMHGRGTYHYPNGDRYTGQFANDVKDGPGTYHFKNGDRWEGSYLRGKKHGAAVYIWETGQRKEELWDQGKKVQ